MGSTISEKQNKKRFAKTAVLITVGVVLITLLVIVFVFAIILADSANIPEASRLVTSTDHFEEFEDPEETIEEAMTKTVKTKEDKTKRRITKRTTKGTTKGTTKVTTEVTTKVTTKVYNVKGRKGKRFNESITPEDIRLPQTTLPTNYKLEIKPYLSEYVYFMNLTDSNIFEGEVTISIKTLKPIREIVLHSVDLEYDTDNCSVKVKSDYIAIDSIEIVPELEMVFINLASPIEAEEDVFLKLVYSGPIRDDLTGLYLLKKSFDEMLLTQMYPNYARRVVPCYDEPSIKAPWTLSLIHSTSHAVLANQMAKSEKTIDDHFLQTDFEKTPNISAHSLAFVFGMLHSKTHTKKNISIRLYEISDGFDNDMYNFSAEIALNAMDYYADIFKTPYPLKKLDIVIVPDMSRIELTSLGLIAYREIDVMFHESEKSESQLKSVVYKTYYGIAQMWFGNLVTTKWWNDGWLNKALAQFYAYNLADRNTKYNMNSRKLATFATAINADIVRVSHPIRVTNGEVHESMFDETLYDKAAIILGMIEKVIGTEEFISATRSYVERHINESADMNDFINYLESAAGEKSDLNLTEFLHQWTEQPGYLALHFTQQETSCEIRQEVNINLNNATEPCDDNSSCLMQVPLWMESNSSGSTPKLVVLEKLDFQTDQILYINWPGYYIMDDIHDCFDYNDLPGESRMRYIHELFMWPNDMKQIYKALDLIMINAPRMSEEEFDIVTYHLNEIVRLMNLDSETLLKLVNKLGEKFPEPKKVEGRVIMSSEVELRVHCLFGVSIIPESRCHQYLGPLRELELEYESFLEMRIHNIIYWCEAVRNGEENNIKSVEYMKTDMRMDFVTSALACTNDTNLMTRYLGEFLKTESNLFSKSCFEIFIEKSIDNHFLRPVIFQFFVDHWTKFKKRFSMNILNRVIKMILERLSLEKELELYDKWSANKPDIQKFGYRKTITKRIEWRKRFPFFVI